MDSGMVARAHARSGASAQALGWVSTQPARRAPQHLVGCVAQQGCVWIHSSSLLGLSTLLKPNT
jgi:hypothetical protein